MEHLIFFLLLSWMSFLFAKVEIAIEGQRGWAEKLPTWHLPKGHRLSKLLVGGRPLTGYHVWIQIFVFSFLHIVYLFTDFNLKVELVLLSFFVLFWVFEDFLWFVLNPAFGIKNFKKEKIWWHKDHWWLIAPREYFIFIPLGVTLYLLSVGIVSY